MSLTIHIIYSHFNLGAVSIVRNSKTSSTQLWCVTIAGSIYGRPAQCTRTTESISNISEDSRNNVYIFILKTLLTQLIFIEV